MLITLFGACFTISADEFGIIKVNVTYLGSLPVTKATVWGECLDERYDGIYQKGFYWIYVTYGPKVMDPKPDP